MALTQISPGGITDDAVTDAKLPANSVGNSEMKDDAVGVAELSASGTASSSTFLLGDNSWQAISTTPEGTSILSTGETGTAKFLRVDGDNSCSWQVPPDTNTQVGGATGVDFNDDVKIRSGTGNDLEIYHVGSGPYSVIRQNDGPLYIQTDDTTNGISLSTYTDGETMAKFIKNGAVKLYYDNVQKFQTVSGGVRTAGNLELLDDHEIQFGNGIDLKIHHDATNSVNIINSVAGTLDIKHGAEVMIRCNPDEKVGLYYDNVVKLTTESSGATINGELLVQGGEGETGNLNLWADEGDDNADKWRVKADTAASGLYIQNYASGSWEESIKAHGNGAVELYHDNVKKLWTESWGINIDGNLALGDSEQLIFGGSDDFKIYHGGTNTHLDNNTGNLVIRNNVNSDVGGDIHIMTHDNEYGIIIEHDGACTLLHDNSTRLVTMSTGIVVKGAEGASGEIDLYADEGDDAADKWKIQATAAGALNIYNNDGNWQERLTMSATGGSLKGSWTGVGKVLQVKRATLANDLNTGSTSWTDTGLSETITCASTSNYIYVILSTTPYIGGGSEERFRLNILCTPSGGSETSIMEDNYWAYRTSDDWKSSSGHHDVYYHPNSTAELTINVKTVRQTGGDNMWLGRNATDQNTNTLTIMEIAG